MRREQPFPDDVIVRLIEGFGRVHRSERMVNDWPDENSTSARNATGPWERSTPDPEGLDDSAVDRLRDAIDRLSDKHRDVINGTFFEGLNQIEMARRLKVHRVTVPVYLQQALDALKKDLADENL